MNRQVTGEELAYLANGVKEWARRVRELRTEEGWPVKTKTSGRVDLPVGVYLLEENKQAEPHDRKIDDSVRVAVLERDKFCCRKCKWHPGQRRSEDPRRLLELHHLEYHANGGKNEKDNLITLCNVDHDTVHKNKMDKQQVFAWLEVSEL
ncbi:HNH endonuclease [Telluribacter sp. SYSU D00476]|uniref:HNH endonuclease n=1 Tax=Telluribacter sp. SYSU D00476 TaxID=2811430 RepID=UPI001FF40454|nr:HNH endonuclease [Telluribacter sp. SYSU D00476]